MHYSFPFLGTIDLLTYEEIQQKNIAEINAAYRQLFGKERFPPKNSREETISEKRATAGGKAAKGAAKTAVEADKGTSVPDP